MNKIGTYNMDIRIDNIRDGKLVGFGSSCTKPHACVNRLGGRAIFRHKIADRGMFDDMVEEGKIPNPRHVKGVHSMRLPSQNVS